MKLFLALLGLCLILQTCYAPPVTQNKENEQSQEKGLEDYMEYARYLKEVINALESDTDFRQKLEKADEEHIKSGKIAEELEFVSHHVRTKLDELKRVELERLKELTEKKRQLLNTNEIDDGDDPTHHHLDKSNPHTFEIEDLKKLIAKTTADLAEADKMRRDEFKAYEMQKEFEKQDKLNHTQGEERTKLEHEYEEQENKHKKHEKLHEPGHRAQLEEVWEKQDEMQQDFDPKTFFMLHDLDGNGLWDQDEVKALFIKELDKMYQQGAPEDDMRERVEEMERMRESVFKEIDLNRDGFIDYSEFLAQTKSSDFNQDHGWQGIDEQRPFSDDEWQEYVRMRQHEAQAYGGNPYYPAPPQGYAQPGQFHPGQVAQAPPQQLPHGAYQQPQYQQQFQQPPQHYQQVPQQQQQYQQHQQIPQQQYQQQAPPQQQQNQQVPQQQHYQQNQQVPQQQQQFQQPIQQQQVQQPPQQQQQQYQQNIPQQQQQVQQPPQQQQQQQINSQPIQNQQQPVVNNNINNNIPNQPIQQQQQQQTNNIPPSPQVNVKHV